MWCKNCRQDVPGIASNEPLSARAAALGTPDADPEPTDRELSGSEAVRYYCARCGEMLIDENHGAADAAEATGSLPEKTSAAGDHGTEIPPGDFAVWQWELEQDLHDARRLLRGEAARIELGGIESSEPAPVTATWTEAHLPHVISPQHAPEAAERRTTSPLAWMLMAIGLMGLTCGGVLVGWSFVEQRGELWDLGVPIALAGQAVILIGLLIHAFRPALEKQIATTTPTPVILSPPPAYLQPHFPSYPVQTSPAAMGMPGPPMWVTPSAHAPRQ